MRRRALHVALAVSLVLAGCSVLGDEPVRQSDAVDRLDAARERVSAVESYRFTMTIDASGAGERLTGQGVGAVNATTRQQVMNVSLGGDRTTSYLDNRTALSECQGPTTDGFWGRETRSTESDWIALTPLGRQLDLLSTGDLYHNGTGTVDGREVVHISGRPSPDALSDRDGGSNPPLVGSPSVDSVTVDLWLDAETDRPVRSEVSVVTSGDGETATATITTRYRDYGDRVRVSIPDGVREDAFSGGCPGT